MCRGVVLCSAAVLVHTQRHSFVVAVVGYGSKRSRETRLFLYEFLLDSFSKSYWLFEVWTTKAALRGTQIIGN